MRARRLMLPLLVLGLLLGCTQLRAPTGTAGSDDPNLPAPFPSDAGGDPAPFPSTAPSVATSAPPSQAPGAPTVAFEAFASGVDFTEEAIAVGFTGAPASGRTLASAVLKYDGVALQTFTGAGPYRLTDWNPHVANSVASADPTPVGRGSHTLSAEVTDDAGTVGRASVTFTKPLVLTGWTLLTAMPSPSPTPTPAASPFPSPSPFGLSHATGFLDGAAPPNFFVPWGTSNGDAGVVPPFAGAWAFDPAGAGAWTRLSPTLGAGVTERSAYGLALHPSLPLAYALGGLATGPAASAEVSLVAPQTLAFTALPVLPASRLDPAAAVLDDTLFAFGGSSGTTLGQSPQNTVHALALDPATGSAAAAAVWTAKASMASARSGAVAVAHADKIWVFGGGVRPIEIYDPAADTWALATQSGTSAAVGTPEVWQTATVVPVGDQLLFLGMLKPDGQAVDKVYLFDPATLTWRELGTIPALTGLTAANRPLGRLSAGLVDGALYLLGGVAAGGAPSGVALKALVL